MQMQKARKNVSMVMAAAALVIVAQSIVQCSGRDSDQVSSVRSEPENAAMDYAPESLSVSECLDAP